MAEFIALYILCIVPVLILVRYEKYFLSYVDILVEDLYKLATFVLNRSLLFVYAPPEFYTE